MNFKLGVDISGCPVIVGKARGRCISVRATNENAGTGRCWHGGGKYRSIFGVASDWTCVRSCSIPTPTPTTQAQWSLLSWIVSSSKAFSVRTPAYPSRFRSLGNLSKTQARRNINQPHTSTTIVNRLHPILVCQVSNPSAALSLLPTDRRRDHQRRPLWHVTSPLQLHHRAEVPKGMKLRLRSLRVRDYTRAGEVEEASETLGLSGGSEGSVEACVFFSVIFPRHPSQNVELPLSSRLSSLSTGRP